MFGKFSRRRLMQLAGLSGIGMMSRSAWAQGAATDSQGAARFPSGFIWGTATSAYQVEGAVNEDGRGLSIWDTFSHTPGKIADHTNADRANDHYHRYKGDVALIKALGVKAYRFSIAWPRVFPDGDGAPNPKGLDFYNRLIDELLANGIEPFATLYHWDLPQSLQDRIGGWQSSKTSQAFGDYAGYVAERLSDRVKSFFTLNEPGRFLNFGYGWAIDAPGLKLATGELNQARHNVVLGHGLAVQAIRARARAGTEVGIAENIAACVPAIDTPENVRATEIATRELNAGILGVILEGKYTDHFLEYAGKDAPKFTAGELKIIGTPNDFVGVNIYAPQFYIVAKELQARLRRRALPRLVSAHEFRVAQDRARDRLLGAAHGGEGLEPRDDLYQRERHLVGGQDRRRRQGLRSRPHHVFAQLSRPVAARDIRRSAGARLFPLELDGQFRMDFRLREALWSLSRRLRDAAADSEAQRLLLSQCH